MTTRTDANAGTEAKVGEAKTMKLSDAVILCEAEAERQGLRLFSIDIDQYDDDGGYSFVDAIGETADGGVRYMIGSIRGGKVFKFEEEPR